MHIYIHMYICLYVYIYIYIYILTLYAFQKMSCIYIKLKDIHKVVSTNLIYIYIYIYVCMYVTYLVILYIYLITFNFWVQEPWAFTYQFVVSLLWVLCRVHHSIFHITKFSPGCLISIMMCRILGVRQNWLLFWKWH